jgi:hypothetical protein
VRLLQTQTNGLWDPSVKYSDQLANGDHADDKELEKEEDMTDAICDENGHTNYGYGHTRYDNKDKHFAFDDQHYADNNIKNLFPEHFGTVPRDGFVQTPESYPINWDNMNLMQYAEKHAEDINWSNM